ncbi:MAG TPA: ubiquitin-conjugating enzyme E2 [Armatimonadota bacterium]|jgi:ubiquitin-protein ligase
MNARLRRLYADYRDVSAQFAGHPFIRIVPLRGNPPEAYEIHYRVKGLELDPTSHRPRIRTEHVAQIYLQDTYPREKPKCVMTTPIFHPNFGSYICIDDYWFAGSTLADIIVHIGEMIQYQNYNPKSPLDPVAARWAEQNEKLLPVGNDNLYQPEVDIDFFGEGGGEATPVAAEPAPEPAEEDMGIELC